MAEVSIEADYLVVGAGAGGLAFADTLVAESKASVVIVDRLGQPGGHWNHAYPFVRLHSPSAIYGVNSRKLGEDTIDSAGLNRGLLEVASAAEILGYFDAVMRKHLLPTGRVRYFPLSNYSGCGRFASLVNGTEYRIEVRKKIVDTTMAETEVPSTHPPKYAVAPGMRCIPPNDLPRAAQAERYVVVGAGKTGIDVCLWLLEQGIPSERIQWIVPRDAWLLDRAHIQPKAEAFAARLGAVVTQLEAIHKAETVEHLFELLDTHGQLLRIDPKVKPTRYRCATITQAEVQALRRITNVVRLGRVQGIEADRIVLDRGSVPTDATTLHIDCSASAIKTRPTVPVFDGKTITLQAVRMCQPCFSSALIAHIEATVEDEAEKNRLCAPIRMPDRDTDWLEIFAANLMNQYLWTRNVDVRDWIANSRLDANQGRAHSLSAAEIELVRRFKESAAPAQAKLQTLLKEDA
jgi:hypothetical protein